MPDFKKYKQKIKNYFHENADNPAPLFWMDLVSFLDSSFFPIPPDPFQMILTLAKPHKWKLFALHNVIFSVLGGLVAYGIGFWFFDSLGQPLIDLYDLGHWVDMIEGFLIAHLFIAIFISAAFPVPYKAFTITAGFFHVNIFIFTIASIIGRSFRFFILGYFTRYFGEKYTEKVFKYFNTIFITLMVLLVLYIVLNQIL